MPPTARRLTHDRPLHPPYGRLLPHRPQPFPWGLLQRYLAPVRGLFVSPLAGAAACVALLAGCSDERGPSTLPALSPSLVQSAAPSPTPSLTEEQAVEAAVRFYYDGYARAFASRDAQELAAGSTEDCACRANIKNIAKLVARGSVSGGLVHVEMVHVAEAGSQQAVANVTIFGEDGALIDADGQIIDRLPGGGRSRKAVLLTKSSEGWRVSGILALKG